jgi:hypothetical protein
VNNNISASTTNYIVFNIKGRKSFSLILDKISSNSYPVKTDYLVDLEKLLNDQSNYDINFECNLKSSFETSQVFKEDDIYKVIEFIYTELNNSYTNFEIDVNFLENMGLWDFITASWMYYSELLPTASIKNWGSFHVFKDIERKRHPFKGPSILFFTHNPNPNPNSSNFGSFSTMSDNFGSFSTMSEDCLKFYINGTITKRGEVQEQVFFRNWVVPQGNLLIAIHSYIEKNGLHISSIRDIISDLSELNSKVDFSGFSNASDIENLISS